MNYKIAAASIVLGLTIACSGTSVVNAAESPSAPPIVSEVSSSVGSTKGGKVVIIKGSGFADAKGVTFDDTSVHDVMIVDDSTIKAIPASHSEGVVDVTVTNSAGSGTLRGGFFYSDNYVPYQQCVTINSWKKWNENCDGWHITAVNNTDFPLLVNPSDSFQFHYEKPFNPAQIDVGVSDARLRGNASWAGGPADMLVAFDADDLKKDTDHWLRFIDVNARLGNPDDLYVTCGVFRSGHKNPASERSPGIGCKVLQDSPTSPLRVEFTALPNGEWKK